MNDRIKSLIRSMTLGEKATLLSGLDNWRTKPVDRLGIPLLLMTDGPHGLRLDADSSGKPVPATGFPTASGLASSWNTDLVEAVAAAIGDECRAHGVGLLLGPALNIKRSPLCGRNFEYYSEDPLLAGRMAAAFTRGIQSRGVGACLKHFALNNMETRRQNSDSVCDMRTMREIYLAAFETAVRDAAPWSVMCSYNRINGTFASDNAWLLTTVLRDEWGFDGLVMTDWGALNDRIAAVQAGTELEMPASDGRTDRALVEAVETGLLDEAVLDRAVGRVLRVVFRAGEALRTLPAAPVDPAANHRFARRTAAECMVLLKNEKNLLPLASGRRVAVIGPFARVPRTQGGGSSHVPSWSVDVPLDELRTYFPDAAYARGCGAEDAADEVDGTELEEAVRTAREADVAVLFLGLPDRIESEGYDRTDMLLPGGQVRLLEAVAAVRPETVVVLMNGSPVEMPWADRAEAILEAYLGGDASGGAVADILSGTVSPSGRLAETFPLRLEHNPSYLDFPGQGRTVRYTEGVFTGYRYYSTRKMEVLFPFGHGMSYTTFSYSGLRLSQIALLDNETLGVSLRVRNTGDRQGQEVVQLYVSPGESPVRRPAQELKAFAKIALEPGEERTVVFELDRRAFAWYDEPGMRWRTDNGTCRIRIGASSDDIRLEAGVVVCTSDRPEVCLDEYATLGELAEHPDLAPIVEEEIDRLRAGYGQSSLAAMGEGFAQTVLLTTPLRVMARQSAHGLDRAWMDRLLERCRQALQE